MILDSTNLDILVQIYDLGQYKPRYMILDSTNLDI